MNRREGEDGHAPAISGVSGSLAGTVPGSRVLRALGAGVLAAGLLVSGCGSAPLPVEDTRPSLGTNLPPLPDPEGWGVPVLAMARSGRGALWVGTNGEGIRVLRAGTREWQTIVAETGRADGLAWDVVNSVAVAGEDVIWYGTVGRGFGVSLDGGQTWRNWSLAELGPRWQYVTPNGIRVHGDAVYVATTSGLRISSDRGATWRCITGPEPMPQGEPSDGCAERIIGLPTSYILSLAVGPTGALWVGHLAGLSTSTDRGATWQAATGPGNSELGRVRAVAVMTDSVVVWAAGESGVFVDSTKSRSFQPAALRLRGWTELPGTPRAIVPSPGLLPPLIALSFGMAASEGESDYRIYYLAAGELYRPAADIWTAIWWGPPMWPLAGASTGINRVLAGESPIRQIVGAGMIATAEPPRLDWLGRPVEGTEGNPYLDASQRYGETWGGRLPAATGVAINTPRGTTVRAVAAGDVVYAGAAQGGSRAVAVRHDGQWQGRPVYSVYHHLSTIDVAVGQRVAAGAPVGAAGSTGRTSGERVGLEIHMPETADVALVVGPELQVPQFTVNPQLWLRPLPGTGVVAGRVLDATGAPIAGARIRGFVLDQPQETPHAYVESYGAAARAHPAYNENFALGDVPAGDYLIGVDIEGARIWRRVRVTAGQVTFVELRP
jgi:hypothetical protein